MKNIAIGILVVLVASILLEPLAEVVNVAREKVILNSALYNACRAAEDQSREYTLMRDLDSKVDEERFREYFAEAFESALNVELESSSSGDTLIFRPNNPDQYSDFEVNLNFDQKEDDQGTGRIITAVTVTAKSTYKFKTKYLKLVSDAGKDVEYELVSEQNYTMSVTN